MFAAVIGLLGTGGVGALAWFLAPAKTLNVLTTVWEWLCHRSFWQITTGVAALFGASQWVHIHGLHVWFVRVPGLERQLAGAISARDALKRQLDGITSAKDTQRVITRTNLQTVTRIIHDADTTAHAIETAPTEPGCKTPKEILDANI